MSCPRAARLEAIFAQHSAADLGVEWDLIVPAAVIANDLVTARSVFPLRRFFRTAFRTTLRRHHIALIKKILILFAKNEDLAALNTRDFNIRHYATSFFGGL